MLRAPDEHLEHLECRLLRGSQGRGPSAISRESRGGGFKVSFVQQRVICPKAWSIDLMRELLHMLEMKPNAQPNGWSNTESRLRIFRHDERGNCSV